MEHITEAKPSSGTKSGNYAWRLWITDKQIIAATQYWAPAHADAPTLDDIIELRRIIAKRRKKPNNLDLLCPDWLRNRYVSLRKADLCFPTKKKKLKS